MSGPPVGAATARRAMLTLTLALTALCAGAGAAVLPGLGEHARSAGIVANPGFERGGYTYADRWRPLPGHCRMLRRDDGSGAYSLYLELRRDGDGGVVQRVQLPPHRTLSLRLLATCWAVEDCSVVASLVRRRDGLVLTEVTVDGIERGVVAQNLRTGPGGEADLLVRLVGARHARASIDRVSLGPPVPEEADAPAPDFAPDDLLLEPGQGLRVDADFEPELLPEAARMLQEAVEEITGRPTSSVGAAVTVGVTGPPSVQWPERESYRLRVDESGVTIEARAERGAFWAMMTVIDLLRPTADGGARILGAQIDDRPALPWRIGFWHSLQEPEHARNAARRLARLKLNMAPVSYDWDDPPRRDAAAVAALREVGIEPVLAIPADVPVRPEEALAEARARLDVATFTVAGWWDRDPVHGPLDWDEPGLRAARDAAADGTVIVPAYTSLGHRDDGGGEYEALPEGEMSRWPPDIVACLLPDGHSDAAARQLAEARAGGIRHIIVDDRVLDGTSAALRARERSPLCLGVFITQWGEAQQRAADLAWRGAAAQQR